jgi:hypothetical protein
MLDSPRIKLIENSLSISAHTACVGNPQLLAKSHHYSFCGPSEHVAHNTRFTRQSLHGRIFAVCTERGHVRRTRG